MKAQEVDGKWEACEGLPVARHPAWCQELE